MNYDTWTLEMYKDWLDMCIHCGACHGRGPIEPHNWRTLPPPEFSSPDKKCPSYEYYKFKAYTGQGRLLLAADTFSNDKPISDDLVQIAYSCNSCGVCNEICPTHAPLNVILALREEINEQGCSLPAPLERISENMKNNHSIFGKKNSSKNLPDLPTEGEDVYFSGCYTSNILPKSAHAAIEILKAAGINVAYLGDAERCCGEVAKQGGNRTLFKEMAAHNVEAMKAAGAKRIIVSCAHCYKTWQRDYPALLGDLPFEVVHISELIADLLDEGKIKFNHEVSRKVTYHDPCFLRGMHGAARKILTNIPGLELTEMERYGRWSYCCGAGAKIALNCYPEFSAATGKERLDEALAAADQVVTACPVCHSQFTKTARAEKVEIEVHELSILAAEAMGIPLP